MTQERAQDRRQQPRKVKPFYVAFSADGTAFVPAYGVDISAGGVGILSQLHTPDGEFLLRIMLEERDFTVTVVRQREAEERRDGKLWYAAGVRIVSMEPNDASFVTEFVAGLNAPPANAVLTNLENRFGGPEPATAVEANKREAPRKRKPFYIAFSINDVVFIPAYGLDISRDGMRIFTDVQMPEAPFKIRAIFPSRDFIVSVKKSWDRQVPHAEQTGWITGTRFTEIDPIDREFVDCYANDKPFFSGNKLLEALEKLRMEPDRADLWLPPELLNLFLLRLVESKRLEPLSERAYPLVRYRYEGSRGKDDELRHVLLIESRINGPDGGRRFVTRFAFDQFGGNVRAI